MTSTHFYKLLAVCLGTLLAALTACGGGGGVGSGGTGQAMSAGSGTVTGFASVIVDGEEYEDDGVTPMTELTWGQLTATTARLGQFAEIGFDLDGSVLRARSIRLDAAVAGPVDSVDAGAQSLQVLGQTVVVNTSSAAGPVTVFAGVGGLSDLAAGDLVEVHGVPRWNAQTSRYDVQAGRIEKLTAALPSYRVSGTVQDLQTGASGSTFTLGGLTIDAGAASVLPSGQALENGRRVIVWATAAPVGGALQAAGIRVIVREQGSSNAPSRLGGVVGRLDAAAKTFDVAGVTVTYDGAQVTPPVRPLEDGAYVLMRGRYADDGRFVADHVKLRRPTQDDDDREVRLEGAISDYTSDASFLVRGTEVDASGVNARPGCGSQPLANGRLVEVEGEIRAGGSSGSVVQATKLSCATSP
jgi:hypothetical protein